VLVFRGLGQERDPRRVARKRHIEAETRASGARAAAPRTPRAVGGRRARAVDCAHNGFFSGNSHVSRHVFLRRASAHPSNTVYR
jgi:hypothetical protein